MEQMPPFQAGVALGPKSLGDSLFPRHQLYVPFLAVLLQSEMGRAVPAEPEVFHVVFSGGKSEEPAALKTKQRPGAFRICALGDHSIAPSGPVAFSSRRPGETRGRICILLRRSARLERSPDHLHAEPKRKKCGKGPRHAKSRKNYHLPQLYSKVALTFQAVARERHLPSLTWVE